MQIRKLTLGDLGPFDRLELEFPPGRDPARADVHLLVGPNGCGKSTVLSAIAQCFTKEDTGFVNRARPGAFATVLSDEGRHDVSLRGRRTPSPPDVDGWSLTAATGTLSYWGLSNPQLEGSIGGGGVFAYGGLRTGGGPRVTALSEQTDNPLTLAASFYRPTGSASFLQWLANALAQRALAEEKGRRDRADERRVVLDRVCDGIGEVIGAKVVFDLEITPKFRVGMSIDGAPPLEIDQLPDGLQSLVSWLGDLLMRLDRIEWATAIPVTDRPFVLLLDEVEVHLHPAWQRRVLPMAERLFPNAQILCSTHSPFVITSATDAWIHRFTLDHGRAQVEPPLPSALGTSIQAALDAVLGIREEFDVDTEAHLGQFRAAWHDRLHGDTAADTVLTDEANLLRARSYELATIVDTELRELRRRLGAAP